MDRKRERERRKERREGFTVVVCFCPNRSCGGYSSRQRYRVLTPLRNLACHEGENEKGGEREQERRTRNRNNSFFG